MNQIEKSLLII